MSRESVSSCAHLLGLTKLSGVVRLDVLNLQALLFRLWLQYQKTHHSQNIWFV